jgi:hypothetical protein
MLRIAISGVEADRLLVNPNRGQLFDVVSIDDGPDYVFTTKHATSFDPHRTFVLDTGDVLGVLFDGAHETRSTMTLASGPVFLVGAPFAFPPIVEHARATGDAQMLETYGALHRKWMIETSFPLMLEKAIEFLAAGEMQIVGDVVWIDGVPGPCRMGDAPAFCHEHAKDGVPINCPFIAT